MKNILYVILHGEIYKDRYKNIKETWGKNVDCIFYSDYDDKNVIKVSNRTDYRSNEEKHIKILHYVNQNIKNYEWYFFCDDDTFVNTKKLSEYSKTANKNLIHGSVLEGTWSIDKNLKYCSGGAGYLIHYTLLDHITKNLRILKTGYSDVTLGIHLRNINVGLQDNIGFKSQNPSFFDIPIEDTTNYITFHYIKTYDEMSTLYNLIN
jgi:hypothetical protein